MKNWLKKIWNDPVWSNVIAGVLLAMFAVAYSTIKVCLNGGESISDYLAIVFGYKVNIWITLSCLLLYLAVRGIVRRKNDKKEPPRPQFVNEFTEGLYQGQRWKWRWQWSDSDSLYYLDGLSIVCPVCKEGLLSSNYTNYKCGKCGVEIPYQRMKISHKSVRKQVVEDARQRYSFCKEYIGELPSMTYNQL